MSGIAGIVHFDGRPVEPGQIEAMTAVMNYRGPDGIAHWVRGPVALGQCMLRTTPESLEENQPLANEDGHLVLVMDGRIDNWIELRSTLLKRGAALRNKSDAELVLRAFEAWGEACIDHLEGDFALAIWDNATRRLFCARDRMGHKPLYYRLSNDELAFASDPGALLVKRALPPLNTGMLTEFLADEFHSIDETIWTGIHRLPPAHYLLSHQEGKTARCRYWDLEPLDDVARLGDDEAIELYRELFSQSVRCASRSHRAIAVEVSGGLDSSAVLCVSQNLFSSGQLRAPGLAAYTIAYPEGDPACEIEYARSVGRHLGVPIDESPPEFHQLEWFEAQARRHLDFPGFATTSTSTGLWQRAASKGARVLLNGESGDIYLTGGYGYYLEELKFGRGSGLVACLAADGSRYGWGGTAWRILRNCIATPALHIVPGAQRLLRRASGRNARMQLDQAWLPANLRDQLRRRRDAAPRIAQPIATTRNPGIVRRQSPFLHILYEHCERLAAEYGLESRDPFDSVPFAQFAASLPERMRVRGGTQKYIHRAALAGLMPRGVLERQDKADFSTTFDRQIDLMASIDLPSSVSPYPGFYDREGVRALLECYTGDRRASGWAGWPLWNIVACLSIVLLTEENRNATISP